jgi:hypothetical protein
MGVIISLLTSKLAGPIATAGCVVLTIALVFAMIGSKGHERRANRLAAEIDNPATGWRARLSTCQTNAITLNEAIGRQNAAVEALRLAGVARTAAADKAVQAALGATERAIGAAARISSRPPVGNDTCSRVLDVDRKLVEELGR